jgi:multisubunit Na+/H+ antiporter MnhB subunit
MRYHPTTTYAGLFSGLGAALWTLFEFWMGWHNEHLKIGARTGFVAIVFPIIAIVWALRATKESQAGRLTLVQAVKLGLAVSAVSAAIGAVFFYLYYTAINPAFIELMKAQGQDIDIAAHLAAVIVGSFVVGLLISVIAGALMRSRKEKIK